MDSQERIREGDEGDQYVSSPGWKGIDGTMEKEVRVTKSEPDSRPLEKTSNIRLWDRNKKIRAGQSKKTPG